jgi:hypothetical protein
LITRLLWVPLLIVAGFAGSFLLPTLLFGGESSPAQLVVAAFSQGDLSGWEKKIFKGETDYSIVQVDGRKALRAISRNAASGLVKKLDSNPSRYPFLRWSWKIKHTLKREDATKKSSDDFVARVYVFSRAFFFGRHGRSIMSGQRIYPKGQSFPTPILPMRP